VPKILAEIRAQSYKKYTWPGMTGGAWWLVPAFLAVALVPTPITQTMMVDIFGTAGLLVLLSWGIGLTRFWRDFPSRDSKGAVRAYFNALKDVLTLSNLSSHGAGCTYPTERHSQSRRIFHHLTFYGFMLCFASTSVAAIYDNIFGWKAPYPYISIPVVSGTLGGIGLIAGPLGLLALKMRRDRRIVDPKQDGMDLSFIALLLASAITGLALMILRDTPAMRWLLAIHLALVLALFVTFACGKFVHGIYRSAALLRNALEQRSRDES
jgi:citrate/tricarballylate utilization protein